MGLANIKAYRRLGLIADTAYGWFPPTPVATGWTKGGALVWTGGLLTEPVANPAAILGFAESPHLSTPVQVGIDGHPAVGAGVAVSNRPRRMLIPAQTAQTFIGTLTTVTTGAGALALTDVGTSFRISSANPSTFAALNPGGVWFLDRTAAGNTIAKVIALVDPIGATATDTPSVGNSGQALVEFVITAAGSLFST